MGFGFGPVQVVLLALVVLLLFGKNIHVIMGSIGRGVGEFRKGLDGVEDQLEK